MPKIGNCKIFGHPIFQGRPQYNITTINMYLFSEMRDNTFIKCHGSYIGLKKNSIISLKMIFKKLFIIHFGCPEGGFLSVCVCPNDTQMFLLAKTMFTILELSLLLQLIHAYLGLINA